MRTPLPLLDVTPGPWDLATGEDDKGWILMGDVVNTDAEFTGRVICYSEASNLKDAFLLLAARRLYEEVNNAQAACLDPACEACIRRGTLLAEARGEGDDDVPVPEGKAC